VFSVNCWLVIVISGSVVDDTAIVTLTLVMVKVVPAKNRSLHIAGFDIWAQSIASGYISLQFDMMYMCNNTMYVVRILML